MSMAIVIGPTPPGTGVMRAAFFAAVERVLLQYVEQADPVAARHAGAQVGEGFSEAECGIDFE